MTAVIEAYGTVCSPATAAGSFDFLLAEDGEALLTETGAPIELESSEGVTWQGSVFGPGAVGTVITQETI